MLGDVRHCSRRSWNNLIFLSIKNTALIYKFHVSILFMNSRCWLGHVIVWPPVRGYRGISIYIYVYFTVIRGPRVRQSLTGSLIYSSGRAPQHTTTTECTPMLCMVLFQHDVIIYGYVEKSNESNLISVTIR